MVPDQMHGESTAPGDPQMKGGALETNVPNPKKPQIENDDHTDQEELTLRQRLFDQYG
jgi:hypothetical protein